MFAARARASLKPFFHGRHSFSLFRNREISTIPKRILHNRSNNGVRLSGIKLFHSSPKCYSSESDVGVKVDVPSLFTSLEEDFFSELGPLEKKGDPIEIINLLTKSPEPEISQETSGKKKKKKKKKKVEEASDSISKLTLFTEKPELSWVTNGKRKKEACASLPVTDLDVSSLLKPEKSLSSNQDLDANAQNVIQAIASLPSRNVTDLNVSSVSEPEKSLSPIQDYESEAQTMISSSSEAKNTNEADLILEELNNETVDCSEWTAEIVQEEEEEEACEDQIGMRINRCYEDLDEQITMRRILAKDLDVLLHSVMHLEKNHLKARETNA